MGLTAPPRPTRSLKRAYACDSQCARMMSRPSCRNHRAEGASGASAARAKLSRACRGRRALRLSAADVDGCVRVTPPVTMPCSVSASPLSLRRRPACIRWPELPVQHPSISLVGDAAGDVKRQLHMDACMACEAHVQTSCRLRVMCDRCCNPIQNIRGDRRTDLPQ